jgi:hypothetical protein
MRQRQDSRQSPMHPIMGGEAEGNPVFRQKKIDILKKYTLE